MQRESLPRLKAPAEHGAVLAYPPLDNVASLLTENALRLSSPHEWRAEPRKGPDDCTHASSGPLRGSARRDLDKELDLPSLRLQAQQEILAAARSYLRDAGEPVPDWSGSRFLVAGHQPELFHPGVWVKNVALYGLAGRHDALPLHVIVDNDTVKSTVLRVPYGEHISRIPFDQGASDAPYEERPVLDETLFASLADRVHTISASWPFKPLLADFWQEVRRQSSRTPLLGERLTAARRHLERAFGVQPLEVPLSRICETEAFARFAAHLVLELPRLHAAYNAAALAYRRRHGLRSRNHPVPDLAREGEWYEAPFWIWHAGQGRRRRLFAQVGPATFCCAGAEAIDCALPKHDAAAAWHELRRRGWKVRTRALTTTLFCRLVLGDLFIHGIGGGKYDEVTDDIIRGFFGVEPPRYLILTATLLLPLPRDPKAKEEAARLRHLERELTWNPQRRLPADANGDLTTLVQQKRSWIEAPRDSHSQRALRYERLRALTEELRPGVALQASDARSAHAEAQRRLRLHEVHSSRDYAFCLYPEDMLRGFLDSLLSDVREGRS